MISTARPIVGGATGPRSSFDGGIDDAGYDTTALKRVLGIDSTRGQVVHEIHPGAESHKRDRLPLCAPIVCRVDNNYLSSNEPSQSRMYGAAL